MGAREDYQAAQVRSQQTGESVSSAFNSTYGGSGTPDQGTIVVTAKREPGTRAPAVQGNEKNILDNYRSVTYLFTLAALTPDNLRNPESYRDGSKLNYVIAASKGKGPTAISEKVAGIEKKKLETVTTNEVSSVEEVNYTDFSASELIKGFNNESPGALDLFIDGVEIETWMKANQQTGVAVATNLKFEILEPFSANGFIEALHTSAIAAGWTGYLNACYLLKIDFMGYPDTDDVGKARLINAARYIPIKIASSEMDITEQGTRYRCKAIPFNEYALTVPDQIYNDISFTGETVGAVFDNLEKKLNESAIEREKKENPSAKAFDKYEIYLPKLPAPGESIKFTKDSAIASTKINEVLRENTVYKFPPIESADPNKRVVPSKSSIQFSAGSSILAVIEAVIRDSHYLKEMMSDIEKAKDSAGMVDYFQVIPMTIPGDMDTTKNVHKFTFRYVVLPTKIHFSLLPGQENSQYKTETVKSYIKRTYDYLYTGKNIDVLNFRLNYNNLFYQAAAPKLGNTDRSETGSAAAASNNQQVTVSPGAAAGAKADSNDKSPSRPQAEENTPRASPARTDPYFQLALTAHNSILDGVDRLTGEVEIVGDPYYLVTGGMGNYLPVAQDNGITTAGEANFNAGPVVIRFNFRNPIDISPDTGMMEFGQLTPFSGLYQVLKCRSFFKEGTFKQNLSLVRYRGQIDNEPSLKASKAVSLKQSPKAGEQQAQDSASADVSRAGIKPNDIDVAKMLARGSLVAPLPGQGNKASFSAFKGLTALATLFAGVKALTGGGGSSSGIRANTEAIQNLTGSKLSNSAKINQINDTSEVILPGSGDTVTSTIPNSVEGNNYNALASARIIGDNAIGNTQNGIEVVLLAHPSKTNQLTSAEVAEITREAAANGVSPDEAVANYKTNKALLSSMGVDTRELSGLTGKLDGKSALNILDLIKSVPANVDLKVAKAQGIIMSRLGGDSLKNLPAIAPKLSAKLAALPQISSASSLSDAARSKIIAEATAKGIPIDAALRNASSFGIGVKNLAAGKIGQSGIDALAGKLGTLQSNLNKLTPSALSKEAGISSIQAAVGNAGSSVAQLGNLGKSVTNKYGSSSGSPLDKLMNK
jgi:hypothetical protein